MRIVFMGTPDFAVGALRALTETEHEIVGVVTQPDKPKGRGKSVAYTPVKEEALHHDLPVFQPAKVRDPEFIDVLKQLAPDLIVVAAFGQIIPKAVLELPAFGCVNIHASLLPKYRGAAPIQWAILDGEKETGVTLMQMNEGLDTGDMLTEVTVPIEDTETGGSLFDKLSHAGAKLLKDSLDGIFLREIQPKVQPEESPTPYAAMITKKQGLIDWERDARQLERLVRGLNPWPSAYTYLNGKTLKIWKSCVVQADVSQSPGTVVKADETGIYVACKTGVLCLQEIQLEGKKRMQAGDFLRGHAIAAGTRFSMKKE